MNTNTTLHVDFREHFFINSNTTVEYIQENCLVGDFIIKRGENILYIIERKSISDLCASIKDNRFREQKQRLTDSIDDSSRIVYLIEKSTGKLTLSRSIIQSAITNMVFFHNFKVIYTENKDESILFILDFYKKLCEDKEISTFNFTPSKKSDKNNMNALACQLTTIQGVSWATALVVQSEYITMKNLITCIQDDPFILCKLKPIGKALANKIYTALGLNM